MGTAVEASGAASAGTAADAAAADAAARVPLPTPPAPPPAGAGADVKLPVGDVPSDGGGRLLVAEGSLGSRLMRFPKEPTRWAPLFGGTGAAAAEEAGDEEKETGALERAPTPPPPLFSLSFSLFSPRSELCPLLPRLPRPLKEGTLRRS